MKKRVYLLHGDVMGQSFHKFIYETPINCIKEKRFLIEALCSMFNVDEQDVNIYDEEVQENSLFKRENLKIIVDRE